MRSIVVSIDPDRLRSDNLTPNEIVNAPTMGNVITPGA